MEETSFIQLELMAAFAWFDERKQSSLSLSLQLPPVWKSAGKGEGKMLPLEAGKLRHGGFDGLFGVQHRSSPNVLEHGIP